MPDAGGGASRPETVELLETELKRRGLTDAEVQALLRKKRRRRELEFDLVKTRHRPPSTGDHRAARSEGGDRRVHPGDELCTVDFAAELLKVHPRTVHRFIHEGRLPARRIGKAYRIRRADLSTLAGLPSTPPVPAASLTAFLDVADVSPEAVKLWRRTAATAVASRGPTAPKVELIYEAGARQLKLVVVGSPAAVVAFLAQAETWLQTIPN